MTRNRAIYTGQLVKCGRLVWAGYVHRMVGTTFSWETSCKTSIMKIADGEVSHGCTDHEEVTCEEGNFVGMARDRV